MWSFLRSRSEVDVSRCWLLQTSKNIRADFKQFDSELRESICLYADGFKTLRVPLVGYALVVSLGGAYFRRYRTVGLVSFYCAEALAIVAVLELAVDGPPSRFSPILCRS